MSSKKSGSGRIERRPTGELCPVCQEPMMQRYREEWGDGLIDIQWLPLGRPFCPQERHHEPNDG